MRRSRLLSCTILLVLFAFLAGSCGDDDGGDDAAGAADPTDETSDDASDETRPTDDTADDRGESEPEPVAGDGELPDPCGLLTVADLEAATGLTSFGEGTFNEQLSTDFQSICDWISDDPFATAQVLVNDTSIDLDAQRRSVEEAFDEDTVDVDLAVPAYQTGDGSIVGMVVDDLFVQVAYIPTDASVDPREATVTMAATVLTAFG